MTGKPTPVIVVLSPDDKSKLADHFIKPHDPAHEKTLTGQPRANVLWEGGMAHAHDADRTVLVQVGSVRPFSDISGHHILRLTDAPQSRTEFVARLRSARCEAASAAPSLEDYCSSPGRIASRASSLRPVQSHPAVRVNLTLTIPTDRLSR